jgi:hypothetical protein
VSVFIKIEGVYVLFKKTSGEVSVIFPNIKNHLHDLIYNHLTSPTTDETLSLHWTKKIKECSFQEMSGDEVFKSSAHE